MRNHHKYLRRRVADVLNLQSTIDAILFAHNCIGTKDQAQKFWTFSIVRSCCMWPLSHHLISVSTLHSRSGSYHLCNETTLYSICNDLSYYYYPQVVYGKRKSPWPNIRMTDIEDSTHVHVCRLSHCHRNVSRSKCIRNILDLYLLIAMACDFLLGLVCVNYYHKNNIESLQSNFSTFCLRWRSLRCVRSSHICFDNWQSIVGWNLPFTSVLQIKLLSFFIWIVRKVNANQMKNVVAYISDMIWWVVVCPMRVVKVKQLSIIVMHHLPFASSFLINKHAHRVRCTHNFAINHWHHRLQFSTCLTHSSNIKTKLRIYFCDRA